MRKRLNNYSAVSVESVASIPHDSPCGAFIELKDHARSIFCTVLTIWSLDRFRPPRARTVGLVGGVKADPLRHRRGIPVSWLVIDRPAYTGLSTRPRLLRDVGSSGFPHTLVYVSQWVSGGRESRLMLVRHSRFRP